MLRWMACWAWAAACGLSLSGCQPAASPVPAPAAGPPPPAADANPPVSASGASVSRGEGGPTRGEGAETSRAVDFTTALQRPSDDPNLIEEYWEVYRLQGRRVGIARTTRTRVQKEGQTLLCTRTLTQTQFHRAGMPTRQEMEVTSWDTPQGAWVAFESRVRSAGPASRGSSAAGTALDGTASGEVWTRGTVRGDTLELVTSTLGHQQRRTLPWQPDWGGPFAVDQALRRRPMQPGEQRTVWGLMPVVHLPAATDLKAYDYEQVELPGGPQRLLKLEAITRLGGQAIVAQLWLDAEGRTLRSWIPAIEQEVVRVRREEALESDPDKPYDLLMASLVRLRGAEVPSPQARRAVYRVRRTDGGSIRGLLAEGPGQQIRLQDEQTAEVEVRRVLPDLPAELPADRRAEPPGAAELQPSSFLQSDDPQIVAMARQVAGRETDPWKIACLLERFVADAVRNTDFSQAFVSAAEVARTLEGDCTEHAVLLAALCRAQQIPARVAFGLVYYPPQRGFAYHMWTEVWIRDRWVPLDATVGQGQVGPDHLKLGDSNLAGESALADLLGIVQVFGRLELELVAQE